MNNFPPYDSYKDSGVDWLGEVPAHWDLTRLGTRFLERRAKVSDKDFPPLSVTKQGVLPQLETAAKTNDGDNRKLVKSGDFVINSRSDRKGSSGVSKLDGSVSLINIVLEPKEIESIYCNYLLKSNNFIEEFYRMGHGIVADLWTTRYDEMKAIKIAIPPISEQTAIAEFLDRKTPQIEKAIAQKERLIELLQERRQIFIHNAVTRGLDPNAKMKHSGVDLIGEIPEHWEVNKLGYNLDILSGYAFPSSGFKENGVKLLRGINVSIGAVRWDEAVYWSEEKTKNLEQYYLNADDVVFGMDRPFIAGGMRIAVVRTEDLPCLLLQRVTRIRAINGLTQDYLLLILKSNLFIDYFTPILSGVSVPHISPSQISSFKCCIPSVSEQKEIVDYIANVSIKTEKAISWKQKEIEKLKEYKAVLINSAVTGKIKVCGNSQNAEMKTNYA